VSEGNYDSRVVLLGEGPFRSPSGLTVEVYKNWAVVLDGDTEIAHLIHGALRCRDLHITAVRGPQDGVYVVARYWLHEGEVPCTLLGCGVEGFDARGEWVGVLPSSIEWFAGRLQREGFAEYVIAQLTDPRP
jgi:hypothetical protein